MNRLNRTLLVVALASASSLAFAQTLSRQAAFVDRISVFQSYTGFGPAYHPQPPASTAAQAPIPANQSFLETERIDQALSSGAPTYQLAPPARTDIAEDPVPRNESLAQREQEYQAASSDAPAYQLPQTFGYGGTAVAEQTQESPAAIAQAWRTRVANLFKSHGTTTPDAAVN